MTQNGISSCKIDFLNNSDKTWCIIVNLKIMNFDQILKKKIRGSTLFCKKNTQNGISSCKMDFLNNFEKHDVVL